MNITYAPFTKPEAEKVSKLIQAFYAENSDFKPITLDKIYLTFETFLSQPNLGQILLIKDETNIIGYTILVNFWSNEFGGNILNIDEIYLSPDWRGLGIGTNVIRYLSQIKPQHCVAIQLEVSPQNVLAKKLYQKLGFKKYHNETLLIELS